MRNQCPRQDGARRLPLWGVGLVRVVLYALAFIAAPAFAAQEQHTSIEGNARWFTYYYMNPEPDLVAEAILAASSHGSMKNGAKSPVFFGFLAGVLSKNPTMAKSISDKLLSLPENDQPALILGIWYSTHPDAKALLKEIATSAPHHHDMINHLLTGGRLDLIDIPLEQGAWVLDALWGNFMATGDEAPVIRIISALPWINIRGDVSRLMVGGAARWSLISNAIQHPLVLELCHRNMETQPQEIKEVLRQVVAEAEKDIADGKTG